MLEKFKFEDITEAISTTMKNTEQANEDLRMSDKGELFLANLQLQRTVKDLANEIEILSLKNEQLIDDLKHRTFFIKYQNVLDELNQLKLEHEAIIDYKIKQMNEKFQSSVPMTSSYKQRSFSKSPTIDTGIQSTTFDINTVSPSKVPEKPPKPQYIKNRSQSCQKRSITSETPKKSVDKNQSNFDVKTSEQVLIVKHMKHTSINTSGMGL